MKIERFDWDGNDPRRLAARIRALEEASLGEVLGDVAEIISGVGVGGDEAVIEYERRFGEAAPKQLRVPDDVVRDAAESVLSDPELRAALELAASNVRAVAEAEVATDSDSETSIEAGQRISIRSVPVAAAGAYVPGGAAPYPSTAIMCCVPAKAAGVERVAVASPAGSGGTPDPLILAAAAIAGADDVYAMGGAQAIAALALGTESVEPVDVIVGPGNRYVQEAKRQLFGTVGIDGIAGPSELMVVADGNSNLRHLALDLCSQAEHGDDGLLVACAADAAVLDGLEAEVEEVARDRRSVKDAPLALVGVPSAPAAIELANGLAPEHLELDCDGADVLAAQVLYAGCVFVGPLSATAFGDYAAGSSHVLPTGGAGRFMGPLGPSTFRRRITRVQLDEEGARDLAPTVATLARAEGFPVHAESAEIRGRSAGEAEERPV